MLMLHTNLIEKRLSKGGEIMNQNDELYHYGVLGMKWGVRRYDKLKKKYDEQTKKMSDIRKTKGAGSNSFRKTAKNRYLTKTKMDYQDAKNRNDKVDKYYNKNEMKFAKYVKKHGTDGYFKTVTKPIYGNNLSAKEWKEIDMYEAKSARKRNIGRQAANVSLAVLGPIAVSQLPKLASKGKLDFTFRGTRYMFR